DILPNFEDVAVLGRYFDSLLPVLTQDYFGADELLALVEILAKHHISPKQVSMIFRLIQSDNEQFKAYCWTHFFQLIQRLWHGRVGKPDAYFEFDGKNSVCNIMLHYSKFNNAC